jgi:hypothetical protein
MVNNLYQGMPLDPATGLYYERARWYSSARAVLRQEPKSRYTSGAVHREISQDPLQYINGANTYQFVTGNPVGRVDAGGEQTWRNLSHLRAGQSTGPWHASATGKYFKMALKFHVVNGATVQVPWALVFTRTNKPPPCCAGKAATTIKFKQYASFGSIAETKAGQPADQSNHGPDQIVGGLAGQGNQHTWRPGVVASAGGTVYTMTDAPGFGVSTLAKIVWSGEFLVSAYAVCPHGKPILLDTASFGFNFRAWPVPANDPLHGFNYDVSDNLKLQ